MLVVDIGTDPLAPKIVANLPLMNTIFGPPTNLQITPDGKLALVANSMDYVADGASWKAVPDNKLYVIDLTRESAEADRHGDRRQAALGPVDQSRGRPRADRQPRRQLDQRASRFPGKSVKLIDTVPMGEQVAARRHHARRQARDRGEVSRATRSRCSTIRRRQGHLRQARHAGRPMAVQRRHHAGRQARADRRQRSCRARPTATSTR